jgi:hypothetical protein
MIRPPLNRPSEDFVSVARRLECDDDKATFEAKLVKIVKAKPASKGMKGKAKAAFGLTLDRVPTSLRQHRS